MRTNVPHIFAIGDIIGQPMLAHKTVHEGKVAAEVAAGRNGFLDAKFIPSVAYTDPEVAWFGVTENEAKAEGVKFGKSLFPWAASDRSLSLGRDEGLTKVLFDEASERIIGCGIVGPNAGDLVAEATLAIEMGADAADIGLTIHSPTPRSPRLSAWRPRCSRARSPTPCRPTGGVEQVHQRAQGALNQRRCHRWQ
jgi:dihydrolipoamide dehydrogenase